MEERKIEMSGGDVAGAWVLALQGCELGAVDPDLLKRRFALALGTIFATKLSAAESPVDVEIAAGAVYLAVAEDGSWSFTLHRSSN